MIEVKPEDLQPLESSTSNDPIRMQILLDVAKLGEEMRKIVRDEVRSVVREEIAADRAAFAQRFREGMARRRQEAAQAEALTVSTADG